MFRTTDLRAEAVHDQSSPLKDFGKPTDAPAGQRSAGYGSFKAAFGARPSISLFVIVDAKHVFVF